MKWIIRNIFHTWSNLIIGSNNFFGESQHLNEKFEKIRGQNEGMIFLSHSIIKDTLLMQNLTSGLLSKNQIKKIIILEIEYKKIPNSIPVIINALRTPKTF